MLVKISNDTKEFEEKMNHLKMRLGLKVTSKVAEHCVENYANLDDQNTKNMKEIERLQGILSEIKKNIHAQEHADLNINRLLRETK